MVRLEDRSAYKWLLVALLWLVGCLNYVDRQAIFSVFPLLRRELSLSDVDLALLGTLFLWVYALSSPLGGYLGDRLRRKSIVVSSLLVFTVVTFATGLAGTRSELLGLRSLLGLSEALYLPAALALISDYHSGDTRSRAVGIHQTSLLMGGILGGVFAGYMGDHHGWRPAFYVLGGLGIVLALLLLPLLRESPKKLQAQHSQKPGIRNLRMVLTPPTVLVIMFSGLSVSVAGWVVMAWMPFYLFDRFGLSLTQAGFNATFYFSMATMAGLVIGSFLSDRWARRDRRGRMLLQLIGLCLAVPGLLAVHFAPSAMILVACLFLFGFGRGLWDCNNMPIFCDVVVPEAWSTVYGVFNLANTLGGGLGVLVAGVLRQSVGIGATLSAFSGMLLISAALTWLAVARFLPRDMKKVANR